MLLCGHVYELEREEKNTGNPPVNGRVRLDVRLVEHTLDVCRVDFDYEVAQTNKEDLCRVGGTVEAIQLKLGLGVAHLALIEHNRAR